MGGVGGGAGGVAGGGTGGGAHGGAAVIVSDTPIYSIGRYI